MIAQTLKQAMPVFDPDKSLEGDEYYVSREHNPLKEMESYLLNNPGFQKILFSGHRGSGKSTELNRLLAGEEIKSNFFTVSCSVQEKLDTNNLGYVDILISIGAMIYREAFKNEIKLKEALLKRLESWKNKVIERTKIDFEGTGITIEGKLDAFFARMLGRLQSEYESRMVVREVIGPNISELIDIINSIVDSVKLAANKEIIVGIDGLDKTDLPTAREIFYNYGLSLTQPRCKIIFTIPIALRYSDDFKQIKHTFPHAFSLPNVKISNKDGTPYERGHQTMMEFVKRRMRPELIEEDALKEAIRASGGVFREMAAIMQDSCNKASSEDKEKINRRIIDQSVSKIRNEYRGMLKLEHYSLLEEFHTHRELRGADRFTELFHNLSLLEYTNDEIWCDVHPIVLPLIKEKK